MLVVELIHHIALLLGACFLQRFIVERWPGNPRLAQLLSGVLYGSICVLGMVASVFMVEGIIFDARTVILFLAGLFGGPLTGGVAAVLALGYRLWLGGGGMPVGIATILLASTAGMFAHYHHRNAITEISSWQLLVYGFALHAFTLLTFYFLPLDFLGFILPEIGLPYFLILTLATLIIGILLREIEKIRVFDTLIKEQRSRYEVLFNTASIAIWDEDISPVFQRFQNLRDNGVTDLRVWLTQHPGELQELLESIRIVNINPAGLTLFGASSQAQLARIDSTFLPETREVFLDALEALWSGAEFYRAQTRYQTLDGRDLQCLVSIPLPQSLQAARHVPVSIVNITREYDAEAALLAEQQRLREVIWGTNAGTWEWNVQTGEVHFNERWAEIIGYTLDELSPISIATWQQFVHPDDLKRSDAELDAVFRREKPWYEIEVRMRHRDGGWRWVLDRGNVVEWAEDGKPLRMSGTHSDITRRKEAELRNQRLIGIREVILHCQRIILEDGDETEMLERIARDLVKLRDYVLVWVGAPVQDPDRNVRIVTSAGEGVDYLANLQVRWGDDKWGQGPTGIAIRTGTVQVNHRLNEDPAFLPWAERARRHGLSSSISIPIFQKGEVSSVLNVYSTEPDSFDEIEINLLSELCADLGLALENITGNRREQELRTEIRKSMLGTIRAIANTIEKRDPYTNGHQNRVADLSVRIGQKLGWDDDRLEGLRLGALIHDIGKIHIPMEILNRPGRLSEAELNIIKTHPTIGYEIICEISFPWPIGAMVVQHHERMDGSGYPAGLKGEQIIDESRIIAVADVVEAITSHRPYRPGLGLDAALAEIQDGQGSRYDEHIAAICLSLFRDEGFGWEDTEVESGTDAGNVDHLLT